MQVESDIRLGCECCIRFENEVLMQRRSPKSQFYPNYLSFPGGKVSLGETYLDAVIREVFEETSIKLESSDLTLSASIVNIHLDKGTIWIINTFKVRFLVKPLAVDCEEGKLEWIESLELLRRDDVAPPVQPYLSRIFNDNIQTFFMSADLLDGHIVKINSELLLKQ